MDKGCHTVVYWKIKCLSLIGKLLFSSHLMFSSQKKKLTFTNRQKKKHIFIPTKKAMKDLKAITTYVSIQETCSSQEYASIIYICVGYPLFFLKFLFFLLEKLMYFSIKIKKSSYIWQERLYVQKGGSIFPFFIS